MKNISSIMNPKSIAVIGATDRVGSVGWALCRNILQGGYQGVFYPVNPTKRSVLSVRAYPSLLAIPDEVDLGVVVVPAKMVPEVMEEAAAKGLKGLVIITAGFKEGGGEGVTREQELIALADKHKIRMIGPNCLGVMNTHPEVSMNATFARKLPKRGKIAFISQSGALCNAVLDFAEAKHIGFSKFISFGNKADVDEIDLLRYLKDDPETRVIAMYLEDISDGRKFIEIAREITWEAQKPMLAIKSGRSSEGAKAAASHTGSLAGSDLAYDAIFGQSGILRVNTMNELFDSAFAFANQPRPKGNRIAIVTNAGGPGILATDAAIRSGLELAKFEPETEEKLKACLPATANVHNPVDLIGDARQDRYEAALRTVIADPNVDGVVVILTPPPMIDSRATAEIIPNVCKDCGKPVVCSFMGIVDVSAGVEYLEDHGFPNYPFPEYAVRAISNMVKFGWLLGLSHREVRRIAADRAAAHDIIGRKLGDQDRVMLPAVDANEILRAYGFPCLQSVLVSDLAQIEKAGVDIGYPVAMKVSSRDIVHKFDVGGVKLNLKDVAQAKQAFTEIMANAKKHRPDAVVDGVLMERMARGGIEVILGASRDPRFGPICMFGLGGTFVEAIKDVSFRLAPMWEVSAEIMINSIKTYKILKGVRGMPPSDIDAIKDCLLRLSQMVSDHPEITELDINPLIVYPEGEGCVVADSRILLVKQKG